MIIGSLSKTYAMTGWRLGYALAPQQMVSAMQKLQSQCTSNPTSIVQKAAVARAEWPAGLRQGDAARNTSGCATAWWAACARFRAFMHRAQRRVLCLSQRLAFFGREGINSATDVAAPAAARSPRGRRPGRGFGTKQHIRISYAASQSRLSAGWSACGSSSGLVMTVGGCVSVVPGRILPASSGQGPFPTGNFGSQAHL